MGNGWGDGRAGSVCGDIVSWVCCQDRERRSRAANEADRDDKRRSRDSSQKADDDRDRSQGQPREDSSRAEQNNTETRDKEAEQVSDVLDSQRGVCGGADEWV